jgi:hypothetical protein
MSDAGGAPPADAGSNGDAGAAEAAQAPAVDLSPITNQLGEITSRLDRYDAVLTPQQQQEQAPDPWDFSDVWDPEGQQQPEQPQQPEVDLQQLTQRMQGATQQQIQAAIAEALAPVNQNLSNIQADQDAAYLTESYPEFADPEFAENMIRTVDQVAAQMGLDPGYGRSAAFIEMVYKQQKYDQQARGEVPVGGLTHNDLEGGSGAVPGGHDEVDLAQQIKAAGTPSKFW